MASYIRASVDQRRHLQQRDEQRRRGAEGRLRLRRRRQPQPQPGRRRRHVARQGARGGGRRQGGRALPAAQRRHDARQRRADRRQRHQRRRRAELDPGRLRQQPGVPPLPRPIGAAGIDATGRSTLRDDVFAINAYCPITDLGNADVLYEWLFTVLSTRADVNQNPSPALRRRSRPSSRPTRRASGCATPTVLRLTAANMLDTIKAEVIRSAETYMKADPANAIPALGENFVITRRWPGRRHAADLRQRLDRRRQRHRSRAVARHEELPRLRRQAGRRSSRRRLRPDRRQRPDRRRDQPVRPEQPDATSNFTQYSWDHNSVAGDGSGLDDTGLTWAQYIAKPSTTSTSRRA